LNQPILGIDPGLSETGWALVEPGDKPALRGSGCVKTAAGLPLPLRLRRLHEAMLSVLDEGKPEALALEQLFFMRSTQSMAATSQARGVILLAAELRGVPVFEYNPKDVKLSISGSGAAQKPQMQKMTQLLLGLKETLKPDDVADAAAIALCHLRTQKYRARLAAGLNSSPGTAERRKAFGQEARP
jgi:crossover junction endodeoxyribonuclease RuvC